MKRIDSSEEGIFEIAWSPDSNWVTYVRGGSEICLANAKTDELRVIGPGTSPGFTDKNEVVFEREDEIFVASGGGEKCLVNINDLVKDSPKRLPTISGDGKKMVFIVNNVFHKDSQTKNAYPYRHFLAIMDLSKDNKPHLLDAQWYGGVLAWFPDNDHFTHFEYDSTGGARVHIVNSAGESQGTMFGLYPSVSPDGKRIACKPRTGQNIVVYTHKGDTWNKDDVDTAVYKLPESTGRLSGSTPQWLDNRFVLVDEGGKLFRVDTRKEGATEMKKVPVPTMRGKHTMAISPDRELVAVEVETENGFELRVIPLL